MIIAEPLEIRNIRTTLSRVAAAGGLSALMYRDMLAALTVANEIPEKVVSDKPLEIFVHANYRSEALEMVRDVIIFSWLLRLETSSLCHFDSANTAQRGIIRQELCTLEDYLIHWPTQVEQDRALDAGFMQVCPYSKDIQYCRGDAIWRHGQRQAVKHADVRAGKNTWRNRFCLATFATDIEYGQFIHNDHVQRWR